MKLPLLFTLLFTGILCSLQAQTIKITGTELLPEDKIRIQYRLEDPNEARTYTVRLFALMGNDTTELTQLSGTLGKLIYTGQYEIIWDALAELGRYRGSLSFFISAVPSFLVDKPLSGKSVKQGNPITFTWYGGNSHLDRLQLAIYQYDSKIDTIGTIDQAAQFTWKVPKSLKPGKGYRLQVLGTDATGIKGFSNEFTVKRKTPIYFILAPAIAAVGTLAAILLLKKPLPPPPGTEDFPE